MSKNIKNQRRISSSFMNSPKNKKLQDYENKDFGDELSGFRVTKIIEKEQIQNFNTIKNKKPSQESEINPQLQIKDIHINEFKKSDITKRSPIKSITKNTLFTIDEHESDDETCHSETEIFEKLDKIHNLKKRENLKNKNIINNISNSTNIYNKLELQTTNNNIILNNNNNTNMEPKKYIIELKLDISHQLNKYTKKDEKSKNVICNNSHEENFFINNDIKNITRLMPKHQKIQNEIYNYIEKDILIKNKKNRIPAKKTNILIILLTLKMMIVVTQKTIILNSY